MQNGARMIQVGRMPTIQWLRAHWRQSWLAGVAGLFLVLAGYQLGLPGLHYDEAKEAGVNAMELLTGGSVTAFRGATLHLLGQDWPLMVQDYIGALNVYLALPFLALTGVGVPNLRLEALALGVLALLTLERALSEWWALQHPLTPDRAQNSAPISLAGLIGVSLLAAAPSFVFWNRQGVFVTNATLPFTFAALWQTIHWLRTQRKRSLILAALAAGCALYAKLLAVWVIGPAGLMTAGWLLWRRARAGRSRGADALPGPTLSPGLFVLALGAGLLPLTPLFLFNLKTGGTILRIGQNLTESYYGVHNLDVVGNLPVRLDQLAAVLRGDHLWYLGGLHGNGLAPWLAAALVGGGLLASARPRILALPLLLLTLSVGASLFTVSDLFITHYALLHPLLAGLAGLAGATLLTWSPAHTRTRRLGPWLLAGLLAAWVLLDLGATAAYHRDLSRSGGLADHSDASYHLAYYLRYNGMGAPIVLDWGMAATVRYLSVGAVQPIEIFGYEGLDAPDAGFTQRLGMFLDNPDNVYLLRARGNEVFRGRREAFLAQALSQGRTPQREATFSQRDGTPLFEIWRVR